MKRFVKIVGAVGLAGALLFAGGCGSDSSSTPSKSPVPATVISSGATSATTISLNSTTSVTVPANTVFFDANNNVLSQVTSSGEFSESASALPAAAQTPPSGKALAAFIDLTLTASNGTVVKTPSKPITLTFDASGIANGTVLSVYSFNGTTWNLESTATVTNGQATISITHFSIWAAFKAAAATGTGTGTGGNGTAGGQ